MCITSFTKNYMSVSRESLIGETKVLDKYFKFIQMYLDIYVDKICLVRVNHCGTNCQRRVGVTWEFALQKKCYPSIRHYRFCINKWFLTSILLVFHKYTRAKILRVQTKFLISKPNNINILFVTEKTSCPYKY